MFKKIALTIISLVIVLSSIFLTKLYINQETILFKSVSLDPSFQFTSKYDTQELFFTAKDGGQIHALLHKISNPRGLVLYFHGQGGNLTNWMDCCYDFLDRKYNVLAMDYRTFGKSKGPLSEQNILTDAEMIYDYAGKTYSPHHIILYGRSLGSGIATYIASKYPSKMLILEAPYFSILDQAQKTFPYLPKFFLNLIVKYPLRTDLWIQKVNDPIELFHGTDDRLIPFSSSLKLIALIKNKEKIRLNSIKGGRHNNLTQSKEYQKRLDELLLKSSHIGS